MTEQLDKILNIRLTEEGIERFKKMIHETKIEGKTGMCPRWYEFSDLEMSKSPCHVCIYFFPKINREEGPRDCPCNCGYYDKETILAFLEQIVKQSKEE